MLIADPAMQDLQRILTRSLDLLYSGTTNSSGLQVECDFLLVIKTMETQLLAWHHEWLHIRNATIGSSSPQLLSCIADTLNYDGTSQQGRMTTCRSTDG